MITRILLSAIAVGITAWLLPGVTISAWYITIIVAVVLGIINAFIKPVVSLLSLPVNILTLGLFTFVINALMVELCAWVVNGFDVVSFGSALLFSIVLCVVQWLMNAVFHD